MYKFTDKELNQLMKGFVVTVDKREKAGFHIVEHFAKNNINYEHATISTGDYSCYIKAIPELGIIRDLYIPVAVERKMNADELCSNLQKSTETRFENELIRSKELKSFVILVEDQIGYAKIINGQYRSGYKPEALIGRLNTFKARYGLEIVYLDSRWSGDWIYRHLYYQAKEFLKNL